MTTLGMDPRWTQEIFEAQARALALVGELNELLPVPSCGASRERIQSDGITTLYRYRPTAKVVKGPPLLIIFALVNRPDILDLDPDHSLIRGLLAAGRDVYLLDWGRPRVQDRSLGLADYVQGFLQRAVLSVKPRRGGLDLLGVCQGGTLALLYASLHPAHIRRLVTMVTAVDFQTEDNLLSKWVRPMDIAALTARVGNIPGDWLTQVFLSLMPFRLGIQKYLRLLDGDLDRASLTRFMRMERWIFDSPDQAGRAFSEYVRFCYQENRLMTGTFRLGTERVDLTRVRMPVLNIYATRDHLVPPSASQPLAGLLGTRRYTALAVDTGHIGLYTSRKAREVAPHIARWLARR
jgi:polyhydroxyalkanoate synthase